MGEFMKRLLVAVAAFGAFGESVALAAVTLAAPFRDGAVLQRGVPVCVWGEAGPREKIEVSFAGKTASATADAKGAWKAFLPPLEASAVGRPLKAAGTDGEVTVSDVLVGEVWIASGQSNMEMPLWGGSNRFRDAEGAVLSQYVRCPAIRFFRTSCYKWSATPTNGTDAVWEAVTPETVREFSAVAYFFADELHRALGVPVGILSAHWGGAGIDAWTPREGYDLHPELEEGRFPVTAQWKKEMAKGSISSACQQPTVIYNRLVAPFVPYTAKGVIWYQGEHNVTHDSETYGLKLRAYLDGMRKVFANPSLRLYLAQIAVFDYERLDKSSGKQAKMVRLQMEQEKFAASEPGAGIAILTDVLSVDDVHPRSKRCVAQRLALQALKKDYGFDVVCDSPVFRSAKLLDDGTVELAFEGETKGGWYMYNDNRSTELSFELQDKEGEWHPARLVNIHRPTGIWDAKTGVVAGEKLVVGWRDDGQVFAPKAVRYMHSAPWKGALYTNAGLPIGPFSAAAAK